ncbi:MAG: hypothetical protein JWQ07_48 [Ramlibacter sp.]|nr:hypothetical protein [Ramlibacter sp.]
MLNTKNDATLVVCSALRSRAHSHDNRRRAKDLVWGWVGAKWSRLLPSAAELESDRIEVNLPGRRLSVSTNGDGSLWTLEVAYSERNGARAWITRAVVADTGEADVMAIQTACSDLAAGPTVIAPPKLLGSWVERLELEDGGVTVMGEPRFVQDEEGLAAFCEHVLSQERTLPVIALTNKPNSRFYGVDPRGVAEAVRGLAHVVCLTPELATEAGGRLGKNLVPVPGVPRIYGPNFSPDAVPKDHPLMRSPAASGAQTASDPGASRRLLCQRVCAMSANSSTYEDLLAPVL